MSFTCPYCSMTSHHPADVANQYCGNCHAFTGEKREVTGPCPTCGDVATRSTYDIGSGPELSCASCEWCWGADGQDLKPLAVPSTPPFGGTVDQMREWAQNQAIIAETRRLDNLEPCPECRQIVEHKMDCSHR